jgi:hypothetical protein
VNCVFSLIMSLEVWMIGQILSWPGLEGLMSEELITLISGSLVGMAKPMFK